MAKVEPDPYGWMVERIRTEEFEDFVLFEEDLEVYSDEAVYRVTPLYSLGDLRDAGWLREETDAFGVAEDGR